MGDMTWKSLIKEDERKILPWYGGSEVHDEERSWTIHGAPPPEHGWHMFNCRTSRYCCWVRQSTIPSEYLTKEVPWGYLVGGRFIAPDAKAEPNPNKLVEQTEVVHLSPDWLDWLSACRVMRDRGGNLVYLRWEAMNIAAFDVIAAYISGVGIERVRGVSPALELAFNWRAHQQKLQEERRERIRQERERKKKEEEFRTNWSSAEERRHIATYDFNVAAAEALRVSGAQLLDARNSPNEGEKVVKYRIRDRNLECVVDQRTLQVIDAGVCLTDERTGEKGDSLLTLESLPGVVCEAIDAGVLVVWRHA